MATALWPLQVVLEGDIMYNLRFGILPENQGRISDATCWAVAQTLGMSMELAGTEHLVAGAGLEKLVTRDSVAISLVRVQPEPMCGVWLAAVLAVCQREEYTHVAVPRCCPIPSLTCDDDADADDADAGVPPSQSSMS
jgi:hypothetical protein